MLRGEGSLSKENKTILEWIKENPGRSMREIAEGVGMDGREVARRVMGMNRKWLKSVKRESKNVYYYAETCTHQSLRYNPPTPKKPENPQKVMDDKRDKSSINKCYLYYNGESKTCKEWGKIVGIDPSVLLKRVKSGWSDERALTTSAVRSDYRYITYNGQTRTVNGWERALGYRRGLIRKRLEYGWSVERALTTPSRRKDRK